MAVSQRNAGFFSVHIEWRLEYPSFVYGTTRYTLSAASVKTPNCRVFFPKLIVVGRISEERLADLDDWREEKDEGEESRIHSLGDICARIDNAQASPVMTSEYRHWIN